MSEYLSTQEIAKEFKVSASTIRRFLREGRLTPYRRERQKQNFYLRAQVEEVLTPKPARQS